MIMSEETHRKINELLTKIDKPEDKGLFGIVSSYNPSGEFKKILGAVLSETEVIFNYFNQQERDMLEGIGGSSINLEKSTIRNVLNEILRRDDSVSHLKVAIQDRGMLTDVMVGALGAGAASTFAFLLPISWPMYFATSMLSWGGGFGYVESKHPGTLYACFDCISLAWALNSGASQLCLTLTNDPNVQNLGAGSSRGHHRHAHEEKSASIPVY